MTRWIFWFPTSMQTWPLKSSRRTFIDLRVSGCGAGCGDTAMDCKPYFYSFQGAKSVALAYRRDEENMAWFAQRK